MDAKIESKLDKAMTIIDSYKAQPTHYSISENNIREWWRNQHTTLIVTTMEKGHDENKFVEFMLGALEEMDKLRN